MIMHDWLYNPVVIYDDLAVGGLVRCVADNI